MQVLWLSKAISSGNMVMSPLGHTPPPGLGASTALPTPTPGDSEQEVRLTPKTPKATVGGLSPSRGHSMQIFELTGSGNVLLAPRGFVSKSRSCPLTPSPGVCVREAAEPPAAAPVAGALTAPRISLQLKI